MASDMWGPEDAAVYTAGVDRSPTEVAALFLADHPDTDPVQFLVEACGLDEAAATEAVSWIIIPEPAEEPVATVEGGEPAAVVVPPADATVPPPAGEVELTADGLAGLSRDQLVDIAKTAGITVGNKGAERLTAEILEVVAWADALDAENQES